MLDKIEELRSKVLNIVDNIKDEKTLEDTVWFISAGRDWLVSFFENLKAVDKSIKAQVGKALNELKITAQNIYDTKKSIIEDSAKTQGNDFRLHASGAGI